MRYIKDAQGVVCGFDDTNAEQAALMNSMFYTSGTLDTGCTDITGNWPLPPTTAELWAAYQTQALIALADTDTAMHRIAEGVVLGTTSLSATDVVAFVQYRQSLRAILAKTQPGSIPASLPAKPGYPVGT